MEIETYNKTFEVLDRLPFGNFVISDDYVVQFWNACLENWTGVERHRILGTQICSHFPHFKTTKHSLPLRRIFKGGAPATLPSKLHPYLIPSILWDGEMRIQHATVTPVPSIKGSGFYALFTLQDVTEEARRSMKYRVLRDQALSEAERCKTAEKKMRSFAQELEKTNRDLYEFAFSASHDLQEPLRKIISFGNRLGDHAQHLNDHGKNCLDRIIKSAGRMQSFILELFELSRANKPILFKPTDLRKIVHETLYDLEIRLAQSKGKVDVGKLPTVE
ncbi:MAG: PAS domain-containing protein, partial [Nitrospinales bacterium]